MEGQTSSSAHNRLVPTPQEELASEDIDGTLAERRATRSALQRHSVGRQVVHELVKSDESEQDNA